MLEQIISPLEVLLEKFGKEGPQEHQYEIVDQKLSELYDYINLNPDEKEAIIEDIGKIKFLKDPDTMLGHMFQKPFGYAGDFMIIDKIYRHELSQDYSNWDKYTHDTTACKAVINRKTYIKSLIWEKVMNSDAPFNFLNIASGPARDLKEIYEKINLEDLNTTCVEVDDRAIAYANELCTPFLDQIKFIHRNVFKFTTEEKYDLVWSAGLFDYFDDKTFVRMIAKMYDWVNPGGELVVGNFSEDNPTRPVMETLASWYLHHRSEEHLVKLAMEAGVPEKAISMDAEPLGLNLFMRMKKI